MIDHRAQPIGVVLGGGLGRRLGGPKSAVRLLGRPLISYPLRALNEVLDRVVIVAKADSELPALPGVEVWIEPDLPRHPLTGLVHALSLAGGSPILVCACDLPLVTPALVRELATADPQGAPVVIAQAGGDWQPLLGRYQPAVLGPLAAELNRADQPLQDVVAALNPHLHDVEDPTLLLNVNTPEDLLQAGALLPGSPRGAGAGRIEDQPNVKS